MIKRLRRLIVFCFPQQRVIRDEVIIRSVADGIVVVAGGTEMLDSVGNWTKLTRDVGQTIPRTSPILPRKSWDSGVRAPEEGVPGAINVDVATYGEAAGV